MALFTTCKNALQSRTIWGTVSLGFLVVGQAWPQVAQYIPAGSKLSVVLGLIATIGTIWARIKAKQPLGPVIDQTIATTIDQVHQLGIGPTTDLVTKIIQVQAVKGIVTGAEHDRMLPR